MQNKTKIDFCGDNKIIWRKQEDPTIEEFVHIAREYLASGELQYLNMLADYYESKNTDLYKRYKDKEARRKTPNWFIPTAYYSTLVDSMSGYMFNNVQIKSIMSPESEDEDDETPEVQSPFIVGVTPILDANAYDVVSMQTGTRSLAFNKGAVIVFTYGVDNVECGFISVDPRQAVFIYDGSVIPQLLYTLYIRQSYDKDALYDISIISKSRWLDIQVLKDDKDNGFRVMPNGIDKELFWSRCPVAEYKTELIHGLSSFHSVLPYIMALDALITGNENEVDKLADAFLALSKVVKKEDKENMQEWKIIDGLEKDALAQYVQRDTSPAFREYLSKLLIQEIHKHAHVIDWYSPDSGVTGQASGKALATRLIDMRMFSDRIEKIYKQGDKVLFQLLREFLEITKNTQYDEADQIDLIYHRTPIVAPEDVAMSLTGVDFLSNETKVELCGLDPVLEAERLQRQKDAAGVEIIIPSNDETDADGAPTPDDNQIMGEDGLA